MCKGSIERSYRAHAEEGKIVLAGIITGAVSGVLSDAYAMAGGDPELVIDFSGIRHIDISGINELIKLIVHAKDKGRRLVATGSSPELMNIFRATRIDEAFSFQGGTAVHIPSSYDQGMVSSWARPVDRITLRDIPEGSINLNVDGLKVVGPLQGFGQHWEKTFRVRLPGVKASPEEVMSAFKGRFVDFQPPQNRFYPTSEGIAPGSVVLINARTPAGLICTGVWVVYADETSFALMTPQGHPESGWVSFSAFEEDGCTAAQVKGFARANDPLFEVGFRLMGSREHELIWVRVLESLAGHFGVKGWVRMHKSCIGPDLQWGRVGNIWYNAQVRTMFPSLNKVFP